MSQRDPRVCRTEALLQKALIELVSGKCFDSVTVEEIASRAMVNRATFYRHYQDKYALAERIFGDAIDLMNKALADIDESYFSLAVNPARLETPKAVIAFFECIRKNPRLYQAILGCNGIPGFRIRLRRYIEERMRERIMLSNNKLRARLEGEHQTIPFEIALTLASDFFLECIGWWLETNLQYSSEEIATWMRSFIFAGCLGCPPV
jgi:AcrR family transcriptional regulator